MKLSLSTGLAAGVLALTAAPALAAPANVTVRVEGANVTRVESVRVTTTAAPVSKAGHDCSGTSAGGALDRATGGDWDAGYFDTLGHFVSTIKGETPAGDDYWTVWVNHGAAATGACETELQEGDEVLFFVDRCTYDGDGLLQRAGRAARADRAGDVRPSASRARSASSATTPPRSPTRSRARRSPAPGSTRPPTPPARRPSRSRRRARSGCRPRSPVWFAPRRTTSSSRPSAPRRAPRTRR